MVVGRTDSAVIPSGLKSRRDPVVPNLRRYDNGIPIGTRASSLGPSCLGMRPYAASMASCRKGEHCPATLVRAIACKQGQGAGFAWVANQPLEVFLW